MGAVTAEAAGSSPVVPAILFKAVSRISFKASRAQKGHVSRPFVRPVVFYPATSAPRSFSEEQTSDITAACAACFASVTALRVRAEPRKQNTRSCRTLELARSSAQKMGQKKAALLN